MRFFQIVPILILLSTLAHAQETEPLTAEDEARIERALGNNNNNDNSNAVNFFQFVDGDKRTCSLSVRKLKFLIAEKFLGSRCLRTRVDGDGSDGSDCCFGNRPSLLLL